MAIDKVALQPLLVNQHQSTTGLGVQTIGGHYRAYKQTVTGLLGANAVLASFRWVAITNGVQFCIPLRITVATVAVAAVTAQENDPIVLIVQRVYTASETTNTTAVTLTGNNNKARTSPFSTSQVTQFVVTSAVAGISGGTSTPDANPFGVAAFPTALGAAGSGTGLIDLYRADTHQTEHALVLANNEGFKIQWGATALATGTAYVMVGVEWAEVVKF